MSQPSSPLSLASTWDAVAADYAVEIMPSFEQFAQHALDLAKVTSGSRVVDVATGPGTLSLLAAARGAQVDAVDFSPAMIAQLTRRLEQSGLGVTPRIADGTALPYDAQQFDAGFSMFGLMFFPDRAAGFRELHRVLRPGARAVVSSWQPMHQVPTLFAVISSLGQLLEERGEPAQPHAGFPLSSREECQREMEAAGFHQVEVRELVGSTSYASTREMVASFARSSAPIKLTKQRLGSDWPELERKLTERVCKQLGEGAQRSAMPAYLTSGVRG